jgi:hypothetical protein
MDLVRFVFRALLLAVVLGLILQWVIPGGDRIVDVSVAIFAGATWVFPLAILARWHIGPPRNHWESSASPSA